MVNKVDMISFFFKLNAKIILTAIYVSISVSVNQENYYKLQKKKKWIKIPDSNTGTDLALDIFCDSRFASFTAASTSAKFNSRISFPLLFDGLTDEFIASVPFWYSATFFTNVFGDRNEGLCCRSCDERRSEKKEKKTLFYKKRKKNLKNKNLKRGLFKQQKFSKKIKKSYPNIKNLKV